MMGVLDIILGRDEQGNASKVNMALDRAAAVALVSRHAARWRRRAAGALSFAVTTRSGRLSRTHQRGSRAGRRRRSRHPARGCDGDNDFGPLIEIQQAHAGLPARRWRPKPVRWTMMAADSGVGGGLGDILGDILRGGQGGRGGQTVPTWCVARVAAVWAISLAIFWVAAAACRAVPAADVAAQPKAE